MNKTKDDPRLKILIGATIFVILGALGFTLFSTTADNNTDGKAGKIVLEEKSVDLGTVSMADGLAYHTFKIKNEGDASVTLSDIKTSCMCTTAILSYNGEKSQKFGMPGHGMNPLFWEKEIQPGDTADLVVTYDPLAHGPDAVGPVTRNISFKSKEGGRTKKYQVTFKANVVK